MTEKHPHIIIDAKKQVMKCKACNGWAETKLLVGMEISDAVDIVQGFIKMHKLCAIRHNHDIQAPKKIYDSNRVSNIIKERR